MELLSHIFCGNYFCPTRIFSAEKFLVFASPRAHDWAKIIAASIVFQNPNFQ